MTTFLKLAATAASFALLLALSLTFVSYATVKPASYYAPLASEERMP